MYGVRFYSIWTKKIFVAATLSIQNPVCLFNPNDRHLMEQGLKQEVEVEVALGIKTQTEQM